jgi:hypothetical protein
MSDEQMEGTTCYEFGWNNEIKTVLLIKETEKTITLLDQGQYASKHPYRRNKSKHKEIFRSLDDIKAAKSKLLQQNVQAAKDRLQRAEKELQLWIKELR